MLRVAVPNKGGLSGPAMELLGDAGYEASKDGKNLFLANPELGVQFVFLRPADIAVHVGSGVLDAGITGQDLRSEAGATGGELLELGFGGSSFYFAVPKPSSITSVDQLDGQRVATSFPAMTVAAAERLGITVTPVQLSGSVETAVSLGLADAIADVVETARSLQLAGLRRVGGPLFTSQAVLTRGPGEFDGEKEKALRTLRRRLEGAVTARQYVMVEYNCPSSALSAAKQVTPGVESPTVAPLSEDGWYSVRAMVRRGTEQATLDELYDVGARAVLVTPVQSCRM